MGIWKGRPTKRFAETDLVVQKLLYTEHFIPFRAVSYLKDHQTGKGPFGRMDTTVFCSVLKSCLSG